MRETRNIESVPKSEVQKECDFPIPSLFLQRVDSNVLIPSLLRPSRNFLRPCFKRDARLARRRYYEVGTDAELVFLESRNLAPNRRRSL